MSWDLQVHLLDQGPPSDRWLLAERLWDVDPCRLLSLGSEPVSSLLGLEDSVWAGCANQVWVLQESSLHTQVSSCSVHTSHTCGLK